MTDIDDIEVFFGHVRQAVRRSDPTGAERVLAQLEERVRARMAELERQAMAVAEANALGVELLDTHRSLALRLSDQKNGIELQQEALIRAHDEIEMERNAVAEANVDAIFMLDDSDERLARLEIERTNLRDQLFEDVLTGLYNFRYLQDQLGRELARARRYDRNLSLVVMDVDHFKRFNDTFGHLAGDAVLRGVGAVIREGIRSADMVMPLPAPAKAARYGGEEFVLLLPETPATGARIVAERIRTLVAAQRIEHDGRFLGAVTISAGVACLTPDDPDAQALLERADRALYVAKNGGRNQVRIDDGARPGEATPSG